MNTFDIRNFLKWTSIAINIENPNYTKSCCMKMALKELQKEKQLRNYIHKRSIVFQKNNKNITKKESILKAITEWKNQ